MTGQGDIAWAGDRVFPGHRTVTGKILPAVAGADIAGADAAEAIALILVGRGEREPERALLGPQQAPAAVPFGRGNIAVARGTEMGRKQCVKP